MPTVVRARQAYAGCSIQFIVCICLPYNFLKTFRSAEMSDTVGIAAEAGGSCGQNMDKGGGGNKLDEDGGNKPVEGGEKSEKKREERWKCPNPDCNTWATGTLNYSGLYKIIPPPREKIKKGK